ncbi:hypothetical protein DKX38_014560 [Salix brachista]|uniref:Reverse transcriptase zinc-binding domain-containing protein n=1 Tax=Salix brachista TaxID=2182728 RepID=A0A5N5LI14_9ROSI|nr:hypothetical protein DKX38_014560 [Salix brachista]
MLLFGFEGGGAQQLKMQVFDDGDGAERNERLKDGHRGKFGQGWFVTPHGSCNFEGQVRAAWGAEAFGNPFSRLTTKLRVLKGHLSNLHKRNSSHISSRVAQAEKKWQEAQVTRNPEDIGDMAVEYFAKMLGPGECSEIGSMDHLAIDIYSARVLSSTGLSWNSRVGDIVDRNQWCSPPGARSIQTLWQTINFYPNSLEPDIPIWTLSSSDEFNIQSAWDQMRARKPPNKLSPIIWHPLHVPRQSIILWLATKGRLRTMDRLPRNAENDTTCKLCRREGESHDHLFFNCGYSKKRTTAIGNFLQWISYLALSSTIYHLWRERNRRTFDNSGQPTKNLCDDILTQIRTQLMEHPRRDDIPDLHQRIWNLRD